MAALLRSAPPAVVTALASGLPLWRADLFTFTLLSGAVYDWTSWDSDLTVGATLYSSKAPWLECTGWNVVNTMEVPQLTAKLAALNGGFAGGAQIKQQVGNGLFDGASVLYSEAYGYRSTLGAPVGAVAIFSGQVGAVELVGSEATLPVKGKNNLLDQYAPRNLYQTTCKHRFCDAGCTLSAAAFTSSFTVGAGATASFIPWGGSPPGNAALYQNGSVTFTSGAAAGSSRKVVKGSSAGLTLVYPLYEIPALGDAFTALLGCDKSEDSGSGQSCTDYSNTQHFRGFEFVPPPNAAY